MKTFVIAGTEHEAHYWIINDLGKRYPKNTSLSMSNYVYVSNADKLRGHQDPHGVFVGTWRDRVDIYEIVQALMMQSIHVNRDLERVWNEVKKSRKTKLTPVNGGWINTNMMIQIAAQELSDAIDEQIIKEIQSGNLPTS